MNVRQVNEELALAAYELAEAENHEREAARLRKAAVKRIAVVHANFRDAEREAKARSKAPSKTE